MKKGKGVKKAASPSSSDLNLPDRGSKAERYYHGLMALSRVSAAISGLHELDDILRIGLDKYLTS